VTTSSPRLVVVHGAASADVVLRTEVARFHGVAASAVVLRHTCPRCGSDEHGRPAVMATAAIRHPAWISVARAGELSVVAVTDAGPVGVDVEVEGAASFSGFDDVALHPGERASGADEATRAWVRKEALLKAHGLGLAVDPRDVHLDDDGLVAWESEHPAPSAVWLRDLAVPGHVAAVVVLPPDARDVVAPTVEVRSVS
jgi:4'-phosphopantetheinyl transferase